MSTTDDAHSNDMNCDDVVALWTTIYSELSQKLDDLNANTWVEALTAVSVEGGIVTMGAPTRFARDWVKNNLQKELLISWQAVIPSVMAVEIVVGRKKDVSRKEKAIVKKETSSDILQRLTRKKEEPIEKLASPAIAAKANEENDIFDEKYTFDNFIIGPSNELAYAAAKKVASGSSVTFNPLFFHGGVGLGKTHLMHAIALEMKEKHPYKRVVYLSAEQFMHRFVSALRNSDMQAFKDEFRSLDVLLVDDLQFISGKNSTQEEFFHTFNALVDSKKQIVLSADRSPSDMGNMEERIRSRLAWGLVVDIHQTDYSLRVGIVKSKIELLKQEYPSFFVPDRVAEYLAHHITGNIRELEGAINRVAAYATFTGRPVTLDSFEGVIADLLRMYEKKIGITEIQRKTAEYYHIKIDDLKSARRSREIARPRQIAIYLTKTMTGLSFPEIGRKFGGKDHTTVLHAVRRVEELMAEDNDIADQVGQLKIILKTS